MSIRRVAVGLALIAAAGSAASAGTIKISNPWWGRDGSGGEFRAHSYTGFVGSINLPADAAYAAGGQAGSFGTFCIEIGEFLTGFPNATFNTTVDKWSIKGGVITSNNGPQPGGANTDDLEAQTAFLYHQFRYAKLDDHQVAAAGGAYGAALQALAIAAGTFDYAGGNARKADTRQLQGALWRFEENNNNGQTGAMYNFLVALANYQVTSGASGTWGNTIGNVRVLNLYDQNTGGNIQSQLTIIPLPTAGGMGLAGLLGVLAIRRRIRL